jgi:hypothetical protein
MAFGDLRFSDFNLSEHRSMTGGTGAAGQATVADSYSFLEDNKPDFSGLAEAGQARIGALNRGQMKVIHGVRDSGLKAAQQVIQAKEDAESYKDGVSDAANKSKMGSIIQAGGTLIASAVLSDEDTKENIERIEDALSMLRNLRPVTFNYKEEYSTDYNRVHHGFIAQEYQQVLPDATYHDPTIDKLCIDTGDLIGLLVRAVQQLETKVTRLEAKEALQGVK